MMLRPNQRLVIPRFLMMQLMAPPVLEDQLLKGMTGTTSRHLNIKVLKRVRLAVPSLSRQEEILARLDWILGRLGGIRELRDNQRRALDVLLPSALSKWVV